MRTARKYLPALALVALFTLLLWAGLSPGRLGALTSVTPIPSSDTGPQFITDVNNALAALQQNQITLTPQVIAPVITDLGTVSGAVTCNVAQSSGCRMTLAAPVTSFDVSGGTPGQMITLQISQGTAGGATFSWPAAVQWQGPAPVINQTPGATQLYQLQTFDGVTWYPLVHSSLSGNAITGTGYLPSITGFNGIVQGALNVMAYGATGSTTSVTATTTSGSTSVTLNSPGDFQDGQSVVILHAGPATSLATPAAPTVAPKGESTNVNSWFFPEYNTTSCTVTAAPEYTASIYANANCTTSYTYQIVNVDGNRGMSAPSPATTITNGPAVLSAENRIVVTWPQDPNAVETLVYRCSGSGCTPTLIATVPALPSSNYFWHQFNSACTTNGSSTDCYGYMDMGSANGVTEAFAQDEVYGTALPSGATNQNLLTTIGSGAGTTSITLATAPSVSANGLAMWHDDAPAFNAAIAAACGQQVTQTISAPRSRSVYVPPGTYQLASPLSFFACMGIRMTCASGGVDMGFANNCYLDWHGAGVVVDLNEAGGTIVENFTIPGAKGQGSTPALAINEDSNTTNAVLDPGATGTTNVGGYSPANGQSSTNIVRNVYIGAAGVGVSIGRIKDYLNEKMAFENVQMGSDPTGSLGEVGGYAGYYFASWNAFMLRIVGGMVGNRTNGLWWTKVGSLRVESTDFESNVVDIYASNTVGASGAWFSELDTYSEGAEHHYYSNVVTFPQNARFEGVSGTPVGGNAVNDTLPDNFYMMPGAGGALVMIGNRFGVTPPGSLIAIAATPNGSPGASFDKSVLSMHNVYFTATPFYPIPSTGLPNSGNYNSIARVNVTEVDDVADVQNNGITVFSINHGITSNNPGSAMLGGVTKLTVGTLAPPTNLSVYPQGTTGSTTYTYYAACQDAFGNLTAGSSAATTTTGNATLSSSNWNLVQAIPEPGCVNYYWWRNGTAASDMFAVTPGALVEDTGANQLNGVTQIALPAASQQGVLNAASVQNGCSGSATLASGAATVSNACITGSRPILVSALNDTNLVYVSAQSAGSVTIKSASATDASTVYWAQN
jgi:hypothetical protein